MKKSIFLSFLVPLVSFGQPAYEAVDLGLSVKWASRNIGATNIEQEGDLFAWGEITPKAEYTMDNYQYRDVDSQWTIDIGNEISNTQYDVAKTICKDKWRMPTQKEMLELCEKCSWEWTIYNNAYGYEVTGSNGNKIFMPTGKEQEGHYWSGTLSQGLGRTAIELIISSQVYTTHGTYKFKGQMIRPVIANSAIEEIQIPKE